MVVGSVVVVSEMLSYLHSNFDSTSEFCISMQLY